MDSREMISTMLDDIAVDDAVSAQDKFNTIISNKVADALSAYKVDVAASIYAKDTNEDPISTEE